ncbi:MAG TPA: hypothetical protein VIY48_15240 [Candidatus Paceibacterota bacterium]
MADKQFPMITGRYMDPEELEVLKGIGNGQWRTREELQVWDDDHPGFMADFAMLSTSGYCGWLSDGTVVLTKSGEEAVYG